MVKSKKRVRVNLAHAIVSFLKKLRRYLGEIVTVPYLRSDGRLGCPQKYGRTGHRRVFKDPNEVYQDALEKHRKSLQKLLNQGVILAV